LGDSKSELVPNEGQEDVDSPEQRPLFERNLARVIEFVELNAELD
jgi:hypothetical protein